MKAIIFRTIAVMIAIGLFFTPYWQWALPILFFTYLSKKQPRTSIMSTTDPYV